MGKRETLTKKDKEKRVAAHNSLEELTRFLNRGGLHTSRSGLSPARALEVLRRREVLSLLGYKRVREYTRAAETLL